MADIKIQTTKDYAIFRTIAGNRTLNKSNLKNITKSVAEMNMLAAQPIIVNEDMEIVDGQHRFQIARDNKFPVYYVVIEGGDLRAVQLLNNTARRWNREDYVKSFASMGNMNYKRLWEFAQETGESIGVSIVAILGHGGGSVSNKLKNGLLEFTAEDIEYGETILGIRDEVIKHFDGPVERQEYLIRALRVVDQKGYTNELLEAFTKRGIKIKHQPSESEYLREFENILNYKTREKNLVRLFG